MQQQATKQGDLGADSNGGSLGGGSATRAQRGVAKKRFHMDFIFEGQQWSRDVDARDFTQAAAIISADYEFAEINFSRCYEIAKAVQS